MPACGRRRKPCEHAVGDNWLDETIAYAPSRRLRHDGPVQILLMESVPKISVVVPCFNAAPYVVATLRSVLAQSGFDLEIVVVDDGSTDGSADVVAAAAMPEVTVLRRENRGAAAARNDGIAHARHDWIAFADADDLWLPGKLQAQWALLAAQRGARMVYTDLHLWPSTEPEPPAEYLAEFDRIAADRSRWQGPDGWIYPQLLLQSEVATPTVLIHRSVLDEVGVFDTGLSVAEDYDLWLRVSRVTPILRVHAPMVLYRMHESNTTKRALDRNYKEVVIARAIERWGYRSPDGSLADKAAVMRHLARSWVDFGVPHLVAGNLSTARQAAFKAVRADPSHWTAWKLMARAVLGTVRGGRRPPA
jgi:glycosyltransferase involved in cell wall biosynthesis